MDLLKAMMANRQAMGMVNDPKPSPQRGGKKAPKSERAKRHEGGTKSMRHFIIEEKPSKKVVREHFESLVEKECESSSDSE
jgi:hypothetical protein